MSRLDAIRTIDSSVVKIVNNVAYDALGKVVKYDADAATTVEQLLVLRRMRNAKLAETDWWASSDLTMSSAQTKYRQDLRDITKSATSLDDVSWPEKP